MASRILEFKRHYPKVKLLVLIGRDHVLGGYGDSLLFETESRFETARVVSQGPVGFRAWAESSVRGLKNSRTQELKNSRTQELMGLGPF